MAKKRKVKVKTRKRVKVVAAPRASKASALAHEPAREKPVSAVQAEHILGLAGGILVVIAAVFSVFMELWSSLISLVCGILMIVSVYGLHVKPRISAIFLLVFSILALILAPHGFVVGPILGLIGAIVVLAKGR